MAASPTPQPQQAPPLGSWKHTYIAVAVAAVIVMSLLWWLTETFNTPLGGAK